MFFSNDQYYFLNLLQFYSFFLGGGSNGMVYQIEYQNIQYAMKISNKKSTKEYEIAEKNEKLYN